jgi:protein required for attachment to host cells
MNMWIIVADASRARLFSIPPQRRSLDPVRTLKNPLGRAKSHELGGDAPGQIHKGATGVGSALQPHTDQHSVEVRRFVQELVDVLQAAFDQRLYDELAIAAPARLLGQLRSALGPQLRKRLTASVARDAVRMTVEQLLAEVQRWLPTGESVRRRRVRRRSGRVTSALQG